VKLHRKLEASATNATTTYRYIINFSNIINNFSNTNTFSYTASTAMCPG
jgi:hypothetical protein